MTNLQDKVALVTGATRGIGKSISTELAKCGAQVIGTATSEAGADAITKDLTQYNGSGIVLDITNRDACRVAVDHINRENGGPHILVNNAGVTRDALMLQMKDSDWDYALDVNLTSTFYLCRLVLRNMIKKRWGRIINITSIVGSSGNVGQTNYAASKAGVTGMSKALAKEVGRRNITVNCVAPGFIKTDMTDILDEEQKKGLLNQIPLGHLGCPIDVANAVVFLSGLESNYITGTTLHVNGGISM